MSCTRVTHLGTVYFVLEVFQVAQVLDHTSPCLREHKSSVHARPAPGSLAQHIWDVPPNPEHPEQHQALLKPSQIFSPKCREPVLNPRFAFCCINPVMSALPLAGKECPGAPSGYLFARIRSQRASWAHDSEPQATPRYIWHLRQAEGSTKQTSTRGILPAVRLSLGVWALWEPCAVLRLRAAFLLFKRAARRSASP